MKGLKFIPYFLGFAVISFLGVLFVQANDQKVTVNLWKYDTPELPLGFIIITSVLLGMVIIGVICILELALLVYQNRNLKKRVADLESGDEQKKSITKLLAPSWENKWPAKKKKDTPSPAPKKKDDAPTKRPEAPAKKAEAPKPAPKPQPKLKEETPAAAPQKKEPPKDKPKEPEKKTTP